MRMMSITMFVLLLLAKTITSFEKEELVVPQNEVRMALGRQPLEWDEELSMSLQRSMCLRVGNRPYGLNTFIGFQATPSQAVKAWLSEGQWFNHSDNSCALGHMCLHYLQIVRARTYKLGCATAQPNHTHVWVCCSYDGAPGYLF